MKDVLEKHCGIGFYAVMEIFHIHTVQVGRRYPAVAMEHFNYD